MNWGHKITIVILLFITGMLGMVYVASNQTNQMVDRNYYEKELKYQQIIEATKNLNKLQSNLILVQNSTDIQIQLPIASYGNIINGKVELLRSSDEGKDLMQLLRPNANGIQYISKAKLISGYYTCRIYWENATVPYYKEQQIIITK